MTRRKNGREPTIAQARLHAQAANLRAAGRTYPQIGTAMGIATSTAYEYTQKALAAVPVEAVHELRQIECDRLDAIIARLWDIVHTDHPYVSQGRVMAGISDIGPVITALGQIRQTSESKRKLLGLDAPARQTITVITEDVVDAELRRLEEELTARATV